MILQISLFILFCWALFATVYAYQLFKTVEDYAIRHGDIKQIVKWQKVKKYKDIIQDILSRIMTIGEMLWEWCAARYIPLLLKRNQR